MALRYPARAGWLALVAAVVAAPAAGADRSQPVPLNGAYDTFLDHSRQTFNGKPRPSEPSIQPASFTTTCDASGCIAHWLIDPLADNPTAPTLFDYRWSIDRWVSSSDYPFHCDDGSLVDTKRSDFLMPNGDGSFRGERTFTVGAPGCPGDGPGVYWLPFTLTPS
ncbi:hypothetical protein [Mycobacterium sp. Aquia_213]|uniref:hypothetical protein n=1 Tax=Mycobacterium sp. Aquia_213 TaxID=2991728 RepID=UPI00226DDDC4|nr:hypothetical protein [Mycobacterium sp. Aquia_213]WAC93909.1 hypothetical protein LMQ14_12740 [Mycobacterium sp. Aquia_213]